MRSEEGERMGKITQCDRVLQYMKDFGSITQRQAIEDIAVGRLAARISDLKDRGYMIRTETETGKNRYGESTSYARYSLEE